MGVLLTAKYFYAPDPGINLTWGFKTCFTQVEQYINFTMGLPKNHSNEYLTEIWILIKIYQITWDVFQDTKLIATAKTIWIALLSYGPQWLPRPDVGQWSRIRHDLEPNWNAILDFPTRTWVVHSSVPRPEDWDCDRPNRGYFPLPLFHWARLILKYIFHKIVKRNAPKLWKSCVLCLTAI